MEPPTEVPGGVRVEPGLPEVTGIAGRGSVLPAIAGLTLPPVTGGGGMLGFFWKGNLHIPQQKSFQASRVFPDQIQKPDVIPTARLMKYLSIITEKSG